MQNSSTSLFSQRFSELENQLQELETSSPMNVTGSGTSSRNVQSDKLLNWQVKARNLLASVCGLQSQHFLAFDQVGKHHLNDTNYSVLKRVKAVFQAAKEDFEGGYLVSLRTLVQAEIFSTELEQAEELLSAGYIAASAVVAGVVLETSLRQLCIGSSIPIGKLDRMNADLAKAGLYNSLVAKRIVAMAAVRNSAAHGDHTAFSADDVRSMINEVERFVAEYA